MVTANPDAAPGIFWGPQGGLPKDFVFHELLDPEWMELTKFEDKWGLVILDPHGGALERFQGRAKFYGDYPGIPDDTQDWEKSALLREVRALSRQWIASDEGDAQGVMEAWSIEGFARPPSAEDAWRRWASTINGALGRYRLTVTVELGTWKWSQSEQREKEATSVVTACALQLAETASEGRRLLRCANANCGRPFTRQRTARRDRRGVGHAAGVKFCSRECAKAQSERDRRARRRAETKGGDDGDNGQA